MRHVRRTTLVLAAALFLAACVSGPQEVHWGEDVCAHCQMVISDDRYAAQVVDSRGKAWKFDAIECMVAFLDDDAAGPDGYEAWVADGRTGWVAVETAHFVHSDRIRSPMGGGLTAFSDRATAEENARELDGTVLQWSEVMARGEDGDHDSHGHGDH